MPLLFEIKKMSETLMFTKKFQNKIFDGFLSSGDVKTKSSSRTHLIISYLYFDIYSETWDKVIKRVTTDKFGNAYLKDDYVVIEVKNEKEPIRFHTRKSNELLQALKLTTASQENQSESLSLTKILPTINLSDLRTDKDFYSDLVNIANDFISVLGGSTASSSAPSGPKSTNSSIQPLADCLACIYKIRFGSLDPPKTISDINNNLAILARELRLTFLSIWVSSLELASQLQVNKDFLLRLIASLGNSVALIAATIENEINLSQLLGACAYFCDGGNIAGVYHECKKATDSIATAFSNSRRPPSAQPNSSNQQNPDAGNKATISSTSLPKLSAPASAPCKRPEFSDKLFTTTIMEFAGKLTDIYSFDLESLADTIMKIVIDTGNQEMPPLERIAELDVQMKSFSGDMLRKLKDRRYDPLFQYVFAMWVLRKEPINDPGQ